MTLMPPVQKTLPIGFLAILTGLLLWGPTQAHARGAYALYQFNGSFDSKCVPRVSNPDAVLRQNGIGTRGASGAERQALANGIAKIQHLLGGRPLPGSWRTSYNYITTANARGRYTWNQGAAAINVRRPAGSSNGQNETRLVHEIGHKIGNAGNYGRYNQSVRRKCGITPYCTDPKHRGKRNEEFADAFAAYVTRPSHLKTVCPEAYAFFSQKLFPGSNAAASCGETSSGSGSRFLASGRNGGGNGSTDTYDRRQCRNLLCWLFGINRDYRTNNDDSGTRSSGGNSGRNGER